MMVCNIPYSHEANDDLSLQQGWDLPIPGQLSKEERECQEAERYLGEEQADQKYHQEKHKGKERSWKNWKLPETSLKR